jgi:sugar O-acyltransferase (sialic acid O-acetyltransferase NeuD family)
MKIVIMGAGEQGRVVLSILQCYNNIDVIGFVDVCDNQELWGKEVKGIKIIGGIHILEELYTQGICHTIVAFGDNNIRARLAQQARDIGFSLINVIHTSAVISKDVVLGEGIVIAPNVTINTDVVIGDNVIINTSAIVEHDCIIEDNVHVAPGVHLAGGVKVKKGAIIGIGATVIEDLTIGENSVVGAGAVVIHDVPAEVVVAGVPAKEIRKI